MRFRYSFVFAAFSMMPFLANAQIEIGMKSGVNIATLEGKYSDPKIRVGAYGGGVLKVPLNNNFGLQVELLFSSKGTGTSLTYYGPDYVPPKARMRLNYVNTPILFFYNLSNKLRLLAGPELGYLTSVKANSPDVILDRTRGQPDKFDLSFDLGGEYRFGKKLGLEIRYAYGFQTIHYTDLQGEPWPEKASNRVLQIGFSYILF